MKRFVGSVIAYFGILGALATAFIVSVVKYDAEALRRSFHLAPDRDVIVCGDSLTECGLNPDIWGRLQNFSSSGARIDVSYFRLREILSFNGGKKFVVLIDVSPMCSGFDDREEPLSGREHVDMHVLTLLNNWRDAARPVGSVGQVFREVFIPKARQMWKAIKRNRVYRPTTQGGFIPSKRRGFIDCPEKAAAHLQHQKIVYARREAFSLDGRACHWIRRMADDAKAHGCVPVFYTSPVCPELFCQMQSEKIFALTNGVADLAKEYGTSYLNYLNVDFASECWRDSIHLNSDGAAILTERLKRDMEALGL